MNRSEAALLSAVWLLLPVIAQAASRLPVGRDVYFVEDNLVYQRFLALARDRSYHQYNKDRTSCHEVDQGTWEQATDGTVRLHSVHHALRFRALLAGPLTAVLDSQAKIDALPSLASAIRRFLDSTGDTVFAAQTIVEYDPPPALAAIDSRAETYRRDDLFSLLRQLDHAAATERSGVYPFALLKPPGTPALLILQDAVFQSTDLARVRRDYRVKPGAAPPFYFAQVDARTFFRDLGAWTAFRFPGGTE